MGEAGAGNTYLEMASISTAIGKRINETVLEEREVSQRWDHGNTGTQCGSTVEGFSREQDWQSEGTKDR